MAKPLPGCQTPFICQTSASLHTSYSNWQVGGRLASDYRFGLVTLTPSLGLFGGSTHNDQTLNETLQFSLAPGQFLYSAVTSLHWTDLGGRFGLDGKFAVHPWVTLGLGGWVGWAGRWTDFTGADIFAVSTSPNPIAFSAVIGSDTTTAFLANLEANVTITPSPRWSARAFAGLNYDDSVPAISTPRATGSGFAPTSVTQAGIVYAKETSYYAGGGLTYRFY
jgi:hypothetical protein